MQSTLYLNKQKSSIIVFHLLLIRFDKFTLSFQLMNCKNYFEFLWKRKEIFMLLLRFLMKTLQKQI